MEGTARSRFLALPAELRFQIAEYIITPPPNAGFTLEHAVRGSNAPEIPGDPRDETSSKLVLDNDYSPAASLNLVRVCRQLRDEFSVRAVRDTTLIMRSPYFQWMHSAPPFYVEHLRKLIVAASQKHLKDMSSWPYHLLKRLRLKELAIALQFERRDHDIAVMEQRDIAYLLRDLDKVQIVKICQNNARHSAYLSFCEGLVWNILNTDRVCRYGRDEPDEPPRVWWEWTYNNSHHCLELLPVPPIPRMPIDGYEKVVGPILSNFYNGIESVDSKGMTWQNEPEMYSQMI